MIFIQGTDWEVPQRTAVTLGKFDGMHKGHQKLLRKLKKLGGEDVATVVFTFGTSPYEILKGHTRILMTNEEKEAFCAQAGADYLIEYPFTEEVCHMSPEDFAQKVLVEQLHAKYIVVGTDFAFGYRRQGNVAFLQKMEESCDFKVFPITKLTDENGREISSTYIREELAQGHMEQVADLAGTPYSISGEIVHGNQFGRTYGIPTINMIPVENKLLPPNGVYVSRVVLEDGTYGGVTNIGVRPTVSEEGKVNMETFLFRFSGDVYGTRARVELLHFLRPERKFATLTELEDQIKQDADKAREILGIS